jgi:hypothetical protein
MSPVLPSRTRRSFLATSAAMGLTSVVPVATGAATAIDRELDLLRALTRGSIRPH